VIGSELAGEVVAVGERVERFSLGEAVYGFCGFRMGAYAEYALLPENGSLVGKPMTLPYDEAVAYVNGATTALFFLRELAGMREGDRVLVIGASVSIGTFAVQLARHFGATVTGVCSGRNVDLVRSLGAHDVIDCTDRDFARADDTYDIVFDTVGRAHSSTVCLSSRQTDTTRQPWV